MLCTLNFITQLGAIRKSENLGLCRRHDRSLSQELSGSDMHELAGAHHLNGLEAGC